MYLGTEWYPCRLFDFSREKDELSIASNDLSRVEKEARNYPNAHLIMFDINMMNI